MPAWRQVATAALASGRGGSIMPTRPEEGQVRSPACPGVGSSGSASISLQATASTRSASLAHVGRSIPLARLQIARDAAGREHVERALDDDDEPAVDAVDGGHQLAVGIKGQLGHARAELRFSSSLGIPLLVRRQHDGCFGGVADVLHFVAVNMATVPSQQSAPSRSSLRTVVGTWRRLSASLSDAPSA